MLRLEQIVGLATEPAIAEKLHHLEHHGKVELLRLSEQDTRRHRLRMRTDAGTECAIVIERTQRLCNGSVLLLTEDRAIVVRVLETQWLTLQPCDTAAALEVGYFAGNMHWKVKFQGDLLHIALDGPLEDYLARLDTFFENERVRQVTDA